MNKEPDKTILRQLNDWDLGEIRKAALEGTELSIWGDFVNADKGSFSDLITGVNRQVCQPKHVVRRMIVKAVTGDEKKYPEASRQWDLTHPDQPRLKKKPSKSPRDD